MSLRLLPRRKIREEERDASGAEPLVLSGDARIDGGAAFPSGLSTTASLTLGPNARVRGSVRVAETLVLEAGAVLQGDATVEGDVRLSTSARVEGRVVCRRLLLRDDEEAVADETNEPARRVEPTDH